jgi:hypothetical protein
MTWISKTQKAGSTRNAGWRQPIPPMPFGMVGFDKAIYCRKKPAGT